MLKELEGFLLVDESHNILEYMSWISHALEIKILEIEPRVNL